MGRLSHTNSVKMTLLSMSSRSSLDRAPARCSGGHGFDSCRGLRIFLCPLLVSCRLIHLSLLLPSTKFTIFVHLSTLLTVSRNCYQKLDSTAATRNTNLLLLETAATRNNYNCYQKLETASTRKKKLQLNRN